jgi:hypothetical protein
MVETVIGGNIACGRVAEAYNVWLHYFAARSHVFRVALHREWNSNGKQRQIEIAIVKPERIKRDVVSALASIADNRLPRDIEMRLSAALFVTSRGIWGMIDEAKAVSAATEAVKSNRFAFNQHAPRSKVGEYQPILYGVRVIEEQRPSKPAVFFSYSVCGQIDRAKITARQANRKHQQYHAIVADIVRKCEKIGIDPETLLRRARLPDLERLPLLEILADTKTEPADLGLPEMAGS